MNRTLAHGDTSKCDPLGCILLSANMNACSKKQAFGVCQLIQKICAARIMWQNAGIVC